MFAAVEDIVVHIGSEHEKLVNKAGGKWTIVTLPGIEQRHLRYEIPHAVGNNGYFCFASLAGIGRGRSLVTSQHVVELAKDIG